MPDFFRHKRVLVTGAGGFIASHLCEALLNQGAYVTALVRYSSSGRTGSLEWIARELRSQLNIVSGNVEDAELMRKLAEECEIVFHLAALISIPYSYSAPRSFLRTNVEGTLNLLEAARAAKVKRFIQTSTSEVYGLAQFSPISEAHPLQARSPYSASKIAADKLAESFHATYNVPVSLIRPFNTFGPRQSTRAIIPTIITQALYGNEIRLGRLDPVRDMNYVADTIDGFLKIASTEEVIGKTVNIGSGRGVSVAQMVDTVLSILEKKMPIIQEGQRIRPSDSEVFHLVCDASRAQTLVGWSSQVSFEEGVRRTAKFIADHPEIYRPETHAI